MTHPVAKTRRDDQSPDSHLADRSRHPQERDESKSKLVYVEYNATELLQILMETRTSFCNRFEIQPEREQFK